MTDRFTRARTDAQSIARCRKLVAAVPALSEMEWSAEGGFLIFEQDTPLNRRRLNKEIRSAVPFRQADSYGYTPDYEAEIDGQWVSFQYSPYPEARGYIQISDLYWTYERTQK